MLWNMVCNINKGSQSTASNLKKYLGSTPGELKEEENIHQQFEAMDLEHQGPQHMNARLEETHRNHSFC